MKLLFINSVYQYGSTGRLVKTLKEAAENKGHEVLVAYGRHKQNESEDTFYFGDHVSSFWHLLMTRLFGRHGLHSKRKTKQLIKRIEDFKPDVIHIHNVHGYYLNVPMLFKYLKTIDSKIIWTHHDCWAFSGSGAYFDYDGCEVWDEGCVINKSTKTYPQVWLKPNQERNFKWKKEVFTSLEHIYIITVSDWLKDLMNLTFFNKYEIQRIYNGIDLGTFVPKTNNNQSKTKKLLGVANMWEARKGLDDFVALSKVLPKEYEITLIGLSEKQINELPLNIKGISRTDSIDKLVKYYQEADLYLNLSVEETMGLTTVESLACGTPAIVYDKTAVPEIVDEKSGVIVKANDIDALRETILNFDITDNTIDNCRQRALYFKKEIMVKNHLNLYESC